MFIYREKNNLLFKLHPYTMLLYIVVISLGALIFSHPVFLLGLLISLGLVIFSAEVQREWLGYLKFSLFFIFLIILINIIFVKVGNTVLFLTPELPLLGKVKITLESLLYAVGMGFRFLIIISAFCLFTYAVSPDKLLSVLGKWGNKIVLVIILSTRLYPIMVADTKRIIEVQRCRGVNFQEKNIFRKIKKYIPIINISLLSSLERSFNLAEAMETRGYGAGPRSFYSRELWRPRDFLMVLFILLSIFLAIYFIYKGITDYIYYPTLQKIHIREIIGAGIMSLLLMFPAFINWGWRKFPLLRQKI